MNISSRRDFIKGAGVATLGMIVMTGAAGTVLSCAGAPAMIDPPKTTSAAPSPVPSPSPVSQLTLPWPYKKLDSTAAAERAYNLYYNGGCMYGGFEGIIGELKEKVGAPYDSFPSTMMKYGGGGVSGWGTLCGALNGIAAAIYLTADPKACSPLINEVYGWYGTTALPNYTPAKPKFAAIKASVADSQLCHVSVTKWCDASAFKATSPERAERCAWLTASVVKYTVDLLNQQADGAFKPAFAVPASVTGCLSCHGKGGIAENVAVTNQTDCTNCHTDLGTKHPAK